jgi:hypothetical protein
VVVGAAAVVVAVEEEVEEVEEVEVVEEVEEVEEVGLEKIPLHSLQIEQK